MTTRKQRLAQALAARLAAKLGTAPRPAGRPVPAVPSAVERVGRRTPVSSSEVAPDGSLLARLAGEPLPPYVPMGGWNPEEQ